jgi:uncharacterized protein (DUF697 family)
MYYITKIMFGIVLLGLVGMVVEILRGIVMLVVVRVGGIMDACAVIAYSAGGCTVQLIDTCAHLLGFIF